MSEYVQLSYFDIALASVFLLLSGVVALWLQLGITRNLAFATVRMVVQLLLVGLLLKSLFAIQSPWLTLLVALFMAGFAAREIWARQERRLKGWRGLAMGGGAMGASVGVVALMALALIVQPDPWWHPRFALPLLGMIMGNAMTGVSLSLDTLHTALNREQRAIEAQLLLGANKWQAMRPFIRQAMRAGFMPSINAMAAIGLVSLPGMMTGQILSGVDPNEAVKYQLMVMFLIAGATGMAVILATLGSANALTDARDRLRLDRLRKSPK
ncbi:MAG: iron export ABC transporter permease subunit FetB [Rhodobacteraceae bacterium]|nr:iron export ABC transporter permease subunit FetB [Paracoccaceae bacterium]